MNTQTSMCSRAMKATKCTHGLCRYFWRHTSRWNDDRGPRRLVISTIAARLVLRTVHHCPESPMDGILAGCICHGTCVCFGWLKRLADRTGAVKGHQEFCASPAFSIVGLQKDGLATTRFLTEAAPLVESKLSSTMELLPSYDFFEPRIFKRVHGPKSTNFTRVLHARTLYMTHPRPCSFHP
jgi:hypothetical protein